MVEPVMPPGIKTSEDDADAREGGKGMKADPPTATRPFEPEPDEDASRQRGNTPPDRHGAP